jgi:hypothetical protein
MVAGVGVVDCADLTTMVFMAAPPSKAAWRMRPAALEDFQAPFSLL